MEGTCRVERDPYGDGVGGDLEEEEVGTMTDPYGGGDVAATGGLKQASSTGRASTSMLASVLASPLPGPSVLASSAPASTVFPGSTGHASTR